jgi:hypothetical protein
MTDFITTRIVRDAIDGIGLPPASITSAVVVGPRDGKVVAELRRQLPALADLLVVEPDHRTSPGYAHDVHLDVMAWMLEHRAPIAHTLWMIDPEGERAHGQRFLGAARAVEDLFWSASARFVDRVAGLGVLDAWLTGPSAPRFRAWADAAFEQGTMHAALRWYLLLAKRTSDPVLARRIGIAWGRLGCPGRALAWLRRSDLHAAALRSASVELGEAIEALRADAATTLAANLYHLRREWPAVADAVERAAPCTADVVWLPDIPWRLRIDGERGVVHRDVLPLVVDEHDGQLVELNLPEHPSRLRAQLVTRASLTKRHACIGAVRDWASVVNVLRNRVVSTVPSWTQAVYAVDSQPAALRKLFEAVDVAEILRTDALRSFDVEDRAERVLLDALRGRPRCPVPRIRAALSPVLAAGLDGLDRDRNAKGHAALARIADRDDLHVPARTLLKLREGMPLRVWLWTSIHTTVLQHVARGLADGFRALGHDVDLLVEAHAGEQLEAPEIAASLAGSDPDFAVFLDHVRPEYGALLPRTLPLAGWILDELPGLSDPRVVSRLGRFDLAFAWSRPLAEDYRRRGYPHCDALPFAVDPAVYGVESEAPPEDVVAFATHLSFPFEPTYARGLYREIERRMMAMDEVPSGIEPLAPLLAATVRELGIEVPADQASELSYQCLMIARHVDRVRVADRIIAAGLPIALYGRGWSDIERFAPHARGTVAPGEELRRLYQRHKVVLHINTRCNLHPRVLEAAAAGGFVLARSDGDYDFAPGGVSDCLEVGREICLFGDADDMVVKIRRAFTDEPWRQSYVQAAQRRVHRDHTYAARAAAMLAVLERRLAFALADTTVDADAA